MHNPAYWGHWEWGLLGLSSRLAWYIQTVSIQNNKPKIPKTPWRLQINNLTEGNKPGVWCTSVVEHLEAEAGVSSAWSHLQCQDDQSHVRGREVKWWASKWAPTSVGAHDCCGNTRETQNSLGGSAWTMQVLSIWRITIRPCTLPKHRGQNVSVPMMPM